MRHFLFEEREYQYRVNYKRQRDKRDPVTELARLLRMPSKGAFGKAGGRGKDLRQRCMAKMQYSKSIEAHKVQLEKYLIREGAGLDGEAPSLFGTDMAEYQEHMTGKNFRIFLSPEKDSVDVKALAETFVEKLEKQTGYQVYWQGACHYNTAHPHAHILINGVDKLGREIFFPRDVVKTFMRETSRNLCTQQIGRRILEDLEREREAELAVSRYTKLDDRIQGMSIASRVSPGESLHDRERVLVRLETLRKLNLCTYEDGGYVLRDGWQDDLRANGRYNTFLGAREALRYTSPQEMKVYTGKQGQVTGRVTKIYRTDGDASDNHAVILEGIDGKAYFVPLLKQPVVHKNKAKTPLREGDLITVKTYRTQQGRLTPVLLNRDIASVKKEIKTNRYSGILASEVNRQRGKIFR